MIKKMILLIPVIVSLTSFSFADTPDTEKPESDYPFKWSSLPEPIYTFVPTGEERANNSDFVRFPDWQNMEIVRHKKIKWNLAEQIDANIWNAEFSLLSMKDLVLQDFDIFTPGIALICDDSFVPFAADIHYREKNIYGVFTQGTINSFGVIKLSITEDGKMEFKDINILKFYDLEMTQNSESFMGRYNSAFVTGFISSLLENYLSGDQNKNKLMTDFIKRRLKTPNMTADCFGETNEMGYPHTNQNSSKRLPKEEADRKSLKA